MTERQQLLAKVKGNPDLVSRLLRVAEGPVQPTGKADSPEDIVRLVEPLLAGHLDERLVAVALGSRLDIVDCAVLTVGSPAFTIVDPRQIFRWALTRKRVPARLVLVHNHPSGDPKPSRQDIEVTNRVQQAGRVLGIPLADHIVWVSTDCWVSLAQQGHVTPQPKMRGWT